jgi:SAM-dependent methyltransferase
VSEQIRLYYRKHDDFNRYLMTHEKRVKELSGLYSSNKSYFGKRILDIACGGGILGFIAEKHGHEYVGIDINPDAVNAGRKYGKSVGSKVEFILGDARREKLDGTFNTVTLLGNALCHFNTSDVVKVLANIRSNLVEGAYFIVDYRDVVKLLYERKWDRRFKEVREGKPTISITKECDTLKGQFDMDSFGGSGRKEVEFVHGIWSPFIIEPIMELNGWSLVNRKLKRKLTVWQDVYRMA